MIIHTVLNRPRTFFWLHIHTVPYKVQELKKIQHDRSIDTEDFDDDDDDDSLILSSFILPHAIIDIRRCAITSNRIESYEKRSTLQMYLIKSKSTHKH